MGGAKSSFDFTENENGEVVVEPDSYIDYNYLDNYCILEVYNSITDETELYIAKKIIHNGRYTPAYSEYKNIFNDFTIVSDNSGKGPNNGLEYVKEAPLLGYINSYYKLKARYTYEDMEKIYEIVKENYKFEASKIALS